MLILHKKNNRKAGGVNLRLIDDDDVCKIEMGFLEPARSSFFNASFMNRI